MIAILIFAGRSTRFWPLCEKSFFPIFGTTLLERQIEKLKGAGFKEIVLVAGAHNLKEAKVRFGKRKIIQQKDLDLGMRGALLSALPHCKREKILIVSANDVIDESAFEELRKKGEAKKEGGLILARHVKTYFPGGYLSLKGKRIVGIVEKPKEGTEPSDLVNIVAHVHADASILLKALQETKHNKDDGYEVALDTLFKKFPYEAVPYKGVWHPVKYPWHLLDLLAAIIPPVTKPTIGTSCKIHKTAVIEGAVILGKNVRVFPHATVMGPCFIGDDTIIANNALVRGSSIGKNCVIGYNTEIARSILGNDVWTHSSYFGDSVIGDGCSFGAGTTTGNLRLDEEEIISIVHGAPVPAHRTKLGAMVGDGCRTGIHTCFSPGIKIGAGSFIASMELVTADVPDHSFLKGGMLRPNKKSVAKNREDFRAKI